MTEDARLEVYREYVKDLTLSRCRPAAVITACFYPFFGLLDHFYRPEFAGRFLPSRAAGMAAALLVFALARGKFGKRHAFALSFSLLASAILVAEAIILIRGSNSPAIYLPMLAAMLFPWTWVEAAVLSLLAFVVSMAPIPMGHVEMDATGKLTHFFFLVGIGIMSPLAAHFSSKNRKTEFLLRLDLERTKRQLEDSLEKLKTFDRLKSNFFSNMSHELRTPLTLILTPLEEILREGRERLPKEALADLELMWRNGMRLLRLINNLLDLSKLESGRLELSLGSVDVARLVGEIVKGFEPHAGRKGVALACDSGPEDLVAVCDAERMELVVQNLLSNAVKFTSKGGKVSVRVRADGDHWSIEVSDTGIGIPEDRLSTIFDRFAQADESISRRYGGTGIGLALVKELVALHGGAVTVESKPDEGSTFTVRMPFLRGEPPRPSNRPRTGTADLAAWHSEGSPIPETSSLVAGQAKGGDLPLVLVVEDNPDLRSLMISFLNPRYRVIDAANGEEGLARAREALPDVIVSDVMMPGVSGLELAREIKSGTATRSIPVILLSAKADSESVIEGLQGGADDYIRKPFSSGELLARVQGWIRSRELNQNLLLQGNRVILGDLAGGVAHEFNNPLAIIQLGATNLREELAGKAAPDAITLLDSIDRSVKRMKDLVSSLCAVSGRGTGSLNASLSVASCIRDVVALCEGIARQKGVKISAPSLPEEAAVRGEAAVLRQALLGVVHNAIEAAGSSTGEKSVEIAFETAGDRMLLRVLDSGPGIPKGMEERIFVPFFTTKFQGKGTGLGLSVAKSAIERCGGTIVLEKGRGRTCFLLSLPLVSAPRKAA